MSYAPGYGAPATPYGVPPTTPYGAPAPSYGVPPATYGAPAAPYGAPAAPYGVPPATGYPPGASPYGAQPHTTTDMYAHYQNTKYDAKAQKKIMKNQMKLDKKGKGYAAPAQPATGGVPLNTFPPDPYTGISYGLPGYGGYGVPAYGVPGYGLGAPPQDLSYMTVPPNYTTTGQVPGQGQIPGQGQVPGQGQGQMPGQGQAPGQGQGQGQLSGQGQGQGQVPGQAPGPASPYDLNPSHPPGPPPPPAGGQGGQGQSGQGQGQGGQGGKGQSGQGQGQGGMGTYPLPPPGGVALGNRLPPQQGGLLHESLYQEGAKWSLERSEVDRCYACFVNFDKGRTGSINKNELKTCLHDCMGGRMDPALLERFANMQMQQFETSGKGTVEFRKFIEIYSNLKLGKM